jgi:hypothetical protein
MAAKRLRIPRSLIAMAMAGFMVMAVIGPASADMQSPSGDPEADGWVFGGHSLDAGVYVRGSGGFAYDIYTTSFTLGSGSALLGDGWSEGDVIVGLGGVIDPVDVNPNLTHSVRIVSKFSAGNDTWSAGGTGSFSSAGGDGAVLLATNGPLSPSGNTGHLNPFGGFGGSRVPTALDPGQIHEIPLLQRIEGGFVNTGADTAAGKLIYLREGPDFADSNTGSVAQLLSSWQVFLNVSMLDTGAEPAVPEEGDRAVQALQRSSGASTDGLVTIQAPVSTLEERKQAVGDDLAALLPSGDDKDDKRIEKAIEHLGKSLDPELWADANTLVAKDGKKVFDEEAKAVKELSKVENTDVSGAIAELVAIDGELAQGAIDAAEAAYDAADCDTTMTMACEKAAKELAKAAEEMADAADALADGDAEKAIKEYKKAWERADKALAELA